MCNPLKQLYSMPCIKYRKLTEDMVDKKYLHFYDILVYIRIKN